MKNLTATKGRRKGAAQTEARPTGRSVKKNLLDERHKADRDEMRRRAQIPIVSLRLVRENEAPYEAAPMITRSGDIAKLMAPLIADCDREQFWVGALDVRGKVVHLNQVSVGSVGNCMVYPREVFKTAVMVNASRIFAVHNHPSGNPSPSADDRLVTKRLKDAGEILGIELLDHVIIGANGKFESLIYGF